MALFRRQKRYATVEIPVGAPKREIPEGLMEKCPQCSAIHLAKELAKNMRICKSCGYHYSLSSSERIALLVDTDSFVEWDVDLVSGDPLQFPGYRDKIVADQKKTSLKDAIVTGFARIEGQAMALGVMDSRFRMGSMGSVVGEKIARAAQRALEARTPFVLCTASGGARMQEGVLSLMQMAKTSLWLRRLHEAAVLYVVVLTHPTTGGVSASVAMLGDIHLAEPGALIGFAGQRVIEQTVRQKLPEGFQTAEFLLERGQVDRVVPRRQLRGVLGKILSMHA
ncbi:acetyl-CoA carboxylase, carboxyltransferase subunit beta [Pasteuria penetrans]|uniref:acetyl-CoA carboxylase, carboxyltransferase subunit beta n=1 Tax=Pasteuria penetrans TaxID=86005 RepID=UPI000F930AF3|nr:acetyl-CoA carboxylase, carboxyltransferase subunit beta [Pasteuria penetrans]